MAYFRVMAWVRALVFLGHGYGRATATIGVTQPCQVGQLCNQHVVQGPLTRTPLFPWYPFGAVLPLLEKFCGVQMVPSKSAISVPGPQISPTNE